MKGSTMANRTMKAKALKERRQRRAWAKPLSIAGGQRPNRGVIQEYKERTCLLGVPEYEIDELIRILYGRDPIVSVPPGKVEIAETLKRLKNIIPQLLFFVHHDNSYQRVVVFFNSSKTCWVIAHTNKRRKVTLTSMEYGDKERALAQFERGKTVWVHLEPVKE